MRERTENTGKDGFLKNAFKKMLSKEGSSREGSESKHAYEIVLLQEPGEYF